MSSLFSGSKHAASYAKFRPTTPIAVINHVIAYLSEKINGPLKVAVDVGCGPGQSTRILSPYFEKVIGVDLSENQLKEGRDHPENQPNVSYQFSPAESLPFDENSIQLITAGSAYHWFDHEKFINEAKRKLVSDGVLAVYNRDRILPQGSSEGANENLKNIIEEYNCALKNYRDDRLSTQLEKAKRQNKGMKLCMKDEIFKENISVGYSVKLNDYIGYLSTISSYQEFIKAEGAEKGEALLAKVKQGILRELSLEDENNSDIEVFTKYFVLMGRN